ncbi:MAG: hypothetical protein H7831_18465, partial [Magnetococcus sp. WYHC-3]
FPLCCVYVHNRKAGYCPCYDGNSGLWMLRPPLVNLLFVGGSVEFLAYKKLKEFGHDVKASPTVHGDLLVNGYLVDVKSCTAQYHAKTLKSVYYSYGLTRKEAENVDFLIVYVVPEDRWFVIPNFRKGKLTQAKHFRGYIRMNEITDPKYKFHNATSFAEPTLHENNWSLLS